MPCADASLPCRCPAETDKWSSYRSGGYRATYVFAYLNMAMFSIFFLCLVIFQVGIMKQVKMNG